MANQHEDMRDRDTAAPDSDDMTERYEKETYEAQASWDEAKNDAAEAWDRTKDKASETWENVKQETSELFQDDEENK